MLPLSNHENATEFGRALPIIAMSPPSAGAESSSMPAVLPHKSAIPAGKVDNVVNGETKAVAEIAGKRENFQFSHIRASKSLVP
ncbi:hypothetical protein GJ744_011388 [Endocarpon pusillum]|uniref:Uncharacterized protein n=1 Tax=Endocarpon pusillum TaxID=364733 RepID=A0A8H7AGP3_9EURO|nr:hypothetical protein GJ744_011388 [Endocarpon pusillum]